MIGARRNGGDPPCPSVETLARLGARSVDAPDRTTLEEHLDTCATCRTAYEELERHETLLARLVDAVEPDLPPDAAPLVQIEGYAIEREIHRGGQGVVYAAKQRSTNRRVAIKLLLNGRYATTGELERFRREIDLAARLDHPGFVRVYDCGVTGDGQLYLVMEYVDGRPIDVVSGPDAPIAEVIDLVASAAESVDVAHQRGIVHRDLKPGNVLVEDDGRPRILDLGLATTMAALDDAGSRVTRTGALCGTPIYAAPERLVGNSTIDERVDVYALGVMLFEALTGRLPHAIDGSIARYVEAVCHTMPPRPSSLRAGVPRDLDWIVATALAPERSRRYATAGAFAADLRRFAAREPVAARPAGALYRLTKFAERNRGLTAALAGLFAVLVIGLVVVTSLLVRTVDAEALAKAQLETARAYGDSLRHLLLAAGPDTTEGRDTTLLRELLDAHAERSWIDLQGHPDVQADVQFTLGQAYANLRRYEPARELLLHVEAHRTRSHGPDSRERAEVLDVLAVVHLYLGDSAAAEHSAREAHRIIVNDAAADEVDRAGAMAMLAFVLRSKDDPTQEALAEAVALGAAALEIKTRVRGPHDPDTLEMQAIHASVLIEAERYDEAEPLVRTARLSRRDHFGADSTSYAADTLVLGRVLSKLGRLDEASDFLEEGIELRRRLLGDRSFPLAWPLRELGRVRMRQGRPRDAEVIAREAVAVCDVAMTADQAERFEARGELAVILLCLERHDEARALLGEVIPALEARPSHARFVAWLGELASGGLDPCAAFDG